VEDEVEEEEEDDDDDALVRVLNDAHRHSTLRWRHFRFRPIMAPPQ